MARFKCDDAQLQRLMRIFGLAIDGNLLGCFKNSSNNRNVEKGLFAKVAGSTSIYIEKLGKKKYIRIRNVITGHDDPTGTGNVLDSLPVTSGNCAEDGNSNSRAETVCLIGAQGAGKVGKKNGADPNGQPHF
jgi:hypothetical protein